MAFLIPDEIVIGHINTCVVLPECSLTLVNIRCFYLKICRTVNYIRYFP
jgi:hypothetical protein